MMEKGEYYMLESLEKRCRLFVRNRDIMKENFRWDNPIFYPLCASIYTFKDLEIQPLKIKDCKEIIKESTGIFSNFKSIALLPLASILALEESPKEKFLLVLRAYDILKDELKSSPYLPLAAFVLASMAEAQDFQRIALKAGNIYRRMKMEHPILTSKEDCGFAVLFALSSLSEEKAINEIEKCYSFLRSEFFSGNAVQGLSHTLALGEEEAEEKCRRTLEIFTKLKEKGCRYGTGAELSTLGLLALMGREPEEVASDIALVNDFLLSCKGFGAFGIGKAQRIMYAALLVAKECEKEVEDSAVNTALVNSITSIIIAEQAAIAAAIAASTAAAASSSSN